MDTIRYGVVAVVISTACGGAGPATLPLESPRASEVEVVKGDPPAGSIKLGVIEVVHGGGCGGSDTKGYGTFEGAMALLRNEAAVRNANYVSILTSQSADGCFAASFVIRGFAYWVDPTPPTAVRPAAAPADDGCDPPCSPGYRCSKAVCRAVCNPTCHADQVCRQDRTCGPAEE